jgi:hypothetical protein
MRKALLAAAAIIVLGSASAMALATTTTDNPQNGTSADKMSPTGTPGTAANPTTGNSTTMSGEPNSNRNAPCAEGWTQLHPGAKRRHAELERCRARYL